MRAHLVIADGLPIIGYREHAERFAEAHARTMTGARVLTIELLEHLPADVVDDASSDDWDEAPTPIQPPESDVTTTNPGTPLARARAMQKRSR